MTPLILGIIEGSLASIKAQDDAGGSLPVGSTLMKAIGLSFFHDLPITILVVGGLWAFMAWINSMRMREFRHRLIILTPVIGARAKAEAIARFTWAMTMISRAGLSPQSTFLLALQSVPNLTVRKQLELQGQDLKESDKLSTALRRTGLVPFEYGSIVETGEVTGDVPRALEAVHRASDADFQAQNATAITRSSLFFYILLGVLIVIIGGWLLTKYYSGLIHTILGE
jgi:type II secretory pathway component PulF